MHLFFVLLTASLLFGGSFLQAASVYIAGVDPNGNAFLQITDENGTPTSSEIVLANKVSVYQAIAYGIALSSSKAYIVGQANRNAFLQITDLNGNLVGSNITFTSSNNGAARAVALTSTQAFIVVNNASSSYLEITDLSGNLISSHTLATTTACYGIALSSTKAYIVGENTSNHKACLIVTDLLLGAENS